MDTISKEKLGKYFQISSEAFEKAKKAPENLDIKDETRNEFLELIECYLKDAKHFEEKGESVNAFAALNYAHGLLDAGARIGLWDVGDSRLFIVDDKPDDK